MPIVGFNFDKVAAERIAKTIDKVEIRHKVRIKDLAQEELPIKKAEETLKFYFEYKADYEPKLGNILLEGHLFYVDDPKKIKEIFNNWKKEKKIAQPLMQQLMNTILIKCGIKALNLSQEINMPPHIPLPTLRPQGQRPEDYIG